MSVRAADKLPRGLQRRVAVACQFIGSSPLLVMNNAVEGVPEGDALTILRAVNERARHVKPQAIHAFMHCCRHTRFAQLGYQPKLVTNLCMPVIFKAEYAPVAQLICELLCLLPNWCLVCG